MTKPAKNVAASVRRRLQNHARSTNRPFQEVLEYFAMERFLYRLTQSPHAEKFVLKGALMFTVWGAPATRPTKDIDLLARTENTIEAVSFNYTRHQSSLDHSRLCRPTTLAGILAGLRVPDRATEMSRSRLRGFRSGLPGAIENFDLRFFDFFVR